MEWPVNPNAWLYATRYRALYDTSDRVPAYRWRVERGPLLPASSLPPWERRGTDYEPSYQLRCEPMWRQG